MFHNVKRLVYTTTPSKDVAHKYFNDSAGAGELGTDARGPRSQGGDRQFEEAPAFAGFKNGTAS
jgi:hypothetical protein